MIEKESDSKRSGSERVTDTRESARRQSRLSSAFLRLDDDDALAMHSLEQRPESCADALSASLDTAVARSALSELPPPGLMTPTTTNRRRPLSPLLPFRLLGNSTCTHAGTKPAADVLRG